MDLKGMAERINNVKSQIIEFVKHLRMVCYILSE